MYRHHSCPNLRSILKNGNKTGGYDIILNRCSNLILQPGSKIIGPSVGINGDLSIDSNTITSTIQNDDITSIGGQRKINSNSTLISVLTDAVDAIGGNRISSIGQNHQMQIRGSDRVDIAGGRNISSHSTLISVTTDAVDTIGGNRVSSIGQNHQMKIGGADNVTVTGPRSITSFSNSLQTGEDIETITGSRRQTIQQNRFSTIGVDESITVGNDATLTTQRDRILDVAGNVTSTVGGNASWAIAGSSTLQCNYLKDEITTKADIICPLVEFSEDVKIDGTLSLTTPISGMATVTYTVGPTVSGGVSIVSPTWTGRLLNTINTVNSNLTLSTNQIVFGTAGTYSVSGFSTFYSTVSTSIAVTRLISTDTLVLLPGSNVYGSGNSIFDGIITVSSGTAVSLEYKTDTSNTDGLGLANNLTSNVYTSLTFVRLA